VWQVIVHLRKTPVSERAAAVMGQHLLLDDSEVCVLAHDSPTLEGVASP
jgi:hypothetical protein